jgi:hypothetical protein
MPNPRSATAVVLLYLCGGVPFASSSSSWYINHILVTSLDNSVNYLSGRQISFDVVRVNELAYNIEKQDRECTYSVTLGRVRVTIVAVERQ